MKKILLSVFLVALVFGLSVPAFAASSDSPLIGSSYLTLEPFYGLQFPAFLYDVQNLAVVDSGSAVTVYYGFRTISYNDLFEPTPYAITGSGRGTIMYTTFSGDVWSAPVAVESALVEVGSVTPAVITSSTRVSGSNSQFYISDFAVVRTKTGIFSVFSDFAAFIPALFLSLFPIFWDGGLTTIGILACCALGISVVLFVAYLISKWLRLGG